MPAHSYRPQMFLLCSFRDGFTWAPFYHKLFCSLAKKRRQIPEGRPVVAIFKWIFMCGGVRRRGLRKGSVLSLTDMQMRIKAVCRKRGTVRLPRIFFCEFKIYHKTEGPCFSTWGHSWSTSDDRSIFRSTSKGSQMATVQSSQLNVLNLFSSYHHLKTLLLLIWLGEGQGEEQKELYSVLTLNM